MKICFCIGKLSFSGAENVVRFLLESLSKRGHEVSVMLLERMPSEDEKIEGVTAENAIVKGGGLKNTVKRIRAERRVLKKLKPDVFIIFNCEMAFSAVPASRFMPKTKVIVCERNDPTMVPPSEKRRKLRNRVYKFANAGVYQTETILRYFDKITKPSFVIENPIRERYERCAPIGERKKIFTTAARLDDKQKNQSLMIRAFAKAAKVHPEFELHMLGDGPDLAKYEALIAELGAGEHIKLLGRHPNPAAYTKDGYAFLLTSEFEGMPNALLEAMAVGLPCISTDCGGGGAAALIENEKSGILIARGDEDALVKNILRLMEDESLCEALGEEAYKLNDRLNPDKITTAWEETCRTVCKKS